MEEKSELKMSYNVDLVLCIDVTNSMRPCLNMVKAHAAKLYDDLIQKMKENRQTLNTFRVRVIAFRDYRADGKKAMTATEFLTLPRDTEAFKTVVESLNPEGGGDIPEDGLEALAFAIRSKWMEKTPMSKSRQIIVVWTDAPVHPLGFCRTMENGGKNPNYPDIFPGSFSELTNWWGAPNSQYSYMDQRGKRLLVYGPGDPDKEIPDSMNWSVLARSWNQTIHVQSRAGEGLSEQDYDEIITLLMKTITGR